ncbi:efflux transporter outer membrane subunit [Acidocella sp.]|uniref:efflux transporter outer membrane subunit n=1 Tax=Acidocella sp. TaxID=50710 RepID=UPI0026041A5F|nr:efflux transporter outer membrane subunit [Acidocella sp.]
MKPTGFHFSFSTPVLALALAGCAVGPDFHAPKAPAVPLTADPLPARTAQAGGVAQGFAQGADIEGDWWHLFQSPALDALLKQGLANSPTLAAAQQNLVLAEEQVREGEGALLPTISISGNYQHQVASTAATAAFGNPPSKNPFSAYTLYQGSIGVSYDIDLFGRARRGIEQQEALAQYQREELEAAYLSLTGNLVQAAVLDAQYHDEIVATQKIIADEARMLAIVQAQVADGAAAPAAALQQQAALAQQQAALPPLQAALAAERNQIAAYVGAFPGAFHEQDFTLASLTLPANVPVSVPSQILLQRPDIRAATATLHADTAAVGVADANMLPQITLSGDIGHEAINTATLFTPQTLLWSVMAGVTQPIFEGGILSAQRKEAIATMKAAGAQYQATVVSAFQNVADALSALETDAAEVAAADAASTAAARSLAVTEAQYKLGGQPLTAVLNAQVSAESAQINDIKARAARLSDTAALYVAMGGGWWHRQDVNQKCCGLIP